jgi:hypothetical protein
VLLCLVRLEVARERVGFCVRVVDFSVSVCVRVFMLRWDLIQGCEFVSIGSSSDVVWDAQWRCESVVFVPSRPTLLTCRRGVAGKKPSPSGQLDVTQTFTLQSLEHIEYAADSYIHCYLS